MKKKIIQVITCTRVICNILLKRIKFILPSMHSIIILLSALATIYALAYFRYSIELTSLWNRVNNLFMQAENNNKALEGIPRLQHETLPYPPSLNPVSIYYSFVEKRNQTNRHIVRVLQDLIKYKKDNLSYLDLRNIDLTQPNEIMIRKIKFTKSNFQFSDLSGANLTKTILTQAHFNNAKLFSSKLDEARLAQANLSNADLGFASFHKANLRNAILKDAIVDFATFTDAVLLGADLRGIIAPHRVDFRGEKCNSRTTYLESKNILTDYRMYCRNKNSLEAVDCQKKVFGHRIKIDPTQLPDWIKDNPEKYGMTDVCNNPEIKCEKK